MRFATTINRYIFTELIPPFAISLIFLTFLFLMTRIPDITHMVVNYNTGLGSLLLLLAYSFPRFLEFTIPMSVMISVLLTFMRMAGDNEITALKGGGVSIYRILPPVMVFCFLGFLLGVWITTWAVPESRVAFKKKSLEIAKTNLDVALQERKFNTSFDDVMIYVSSVDVNSKKLEDVFIEDRRTNGMVNISVAPEGILVSDKEKMFYTLRLYDGKINQVDLQDETVNTVTFKTYDINLDLTGEGGSPDRIDRDLDEMSLSELAGFIRSEPEDKKKLYTALMEMHEKFSLPFACIALGILAFPLGIQSVSLRRSSGFGLGIFFFIVYYLLLALGWAAGETGRYPAALGMWLPDLIMGAVGVYLLHRNVKEKPLKLPALFPGKLVLFIKGRRGNKGM
ncbi:MAG: LPS export ABC transporter permease LptF [Desulfobacteraceae bacterium]